MSYSAGLARLLTAKGAEEGDTVRVVSGGKEHTGLLMPHHEFSDPDVLVIKLKSGYNIGIRLSDAATLEITAKAAKRERRRHEVPTSEGKKEVAFLGTGGTIASYVDYRTGAVHPALSATDLVGAVPEMAEICAVRAEVLFSIFSENMTVANWQRLAEVVAARIEEGVEGVVIPHGTDTMGYTAAALSFMLEDLPRPVILVGAQRSSDRPSSDAYTNLLASARFAVESDAAEVCVLMHESTSDESALVHRGCRVRKLHASRRDAFRSVNVKPIARVRFEGGIEYLSEHRRKGNGKVRLATEMEPNVILAQYHPGMSVEAFRAYVHGARGVVVAGTGLGHVSSELVKAIKGIVSSGIPVVMTTQCLYGRVNLNIYDTGRDLLSAGVISGEDMLPETAYVKLMWALPRAKGEEDLRRIMQTDLRGEIGARRELDE
jgi:glutamyl-tRNA(Gln) amidotransferase subunit D